MTKWRPSGAIVVHASRIARSSSRHRPPCRCAAPRFFRGTDRGLGQGWQTVAPFAVGPSISSCRLRSRVPTSPVCSDHHPASSPGGACRCRASHRMAHPSNRHWCNGSPRRRRAENVDSATRGVRPTNRRADRPRRHGRSVGGVRRGTGSGRRELDCISRLTPARRGL
jgi:hypothetical protein